MLFVVLSALFILWTKNPLLAILGLISVFINSSLILLSLNVNFLALIYVVIYVGAICVLFLFVVMLLNLRQFDVQEKTMSLIPFFICYGIYLFIYLFYIGLDKNIEYLDTTVYTTINDFSEIIIISFYLLNHPMIFIVITLLLLLAIIASIIIATQKQLFERRQNLYGAINRSSDTQILISTIKS